ncbi:MAG: putative toxin-antitoxin system toxin component, PIN family [Candidatus Palauibacterales bacterium]|nr:putative toxin-antitoxin system toxin component, PIN family [Candidatus Palauibacterales bacterium]
MTRVCLDSNVLVAAFVARGLCADLLRLVLAEHEMVPLEVVGEEVRRVLAEKLQASEEALSAEEAVLGRFEAVARGDAASPIDLRDPDDERVLADAILADAAVLVSGDDDLLSVAADSPIRILSPRAFMVLVRSGP